MPIFHAIAAMSENRVIGNHGKIPWHLPEDFRWFKHKTMGSTLLMGRVTYQSIGRPLPGRKTVVLTQHTQIPNVETCSLFADYALKKTDELCWVCGGAQIYHWSLDFCRYLYLTRVKGTFDGDAYLPEFEDSFILEQEIHETAQFRIERWINRGYDTMLPKRPKLSTESWPFPEQTS